MTNRDVVAALVAAVTDGDLIRAAEIDAGPSEYAAAAAVLADAAVVTLAELGVLVPVSEPDVLSMGYRELVGRGRDMIRRGAALCWLADSLPGWPSSPGRPLADVLKVAAPDVVARLTAEMKRVGIDLDGQSP